jgi:hypothetical protein
VIAQDIKTATTKSKNLNNEIGLFTVSPIASMYNDNNSNTGLSGLQYTRWINRNKGYKIFAAYGNYNSVHATDGFVVADTAIIRKTATNANLAVIGGALQAQRHFFKKVYLSAAVEIKAGYGAGYTDTTITKYYHYKDLNVIEATGSRGTGALHTFYAGLSPCIGAKLQFKRLSVGLDMLLELLSYTSTQYPTTTGNILDLDLNKINSRIFINYRF